MKTTHILLALLSLVAFSISQAATVTGRSAKTTPAGTEKIPIDDSGVDKYITISNLFVGSPALTTPTLTTPVISTGLTASGSAANNFSGSTGNFLTSTGVNTFGGSSHTFSSVVRPLSDGLAALGSATYGWSDLFLSNGAVVNWNNGNAVLTHSAGVLTLGTGNLIITNAGTASGSVVTTTGTQTLSAKTLTAAVINGATSSGSTAIDFSGNTGAFKTSTGAATFGGSAHTFASSVTPATNDVGALGSASLSWSDLFLASGGVVNIANGNWVATHTSGILTVGTGDLRITTAGTNAASAVTVGGTQTLTSKTLTAPVINGATAASGNFDLSASSGTFLTPTGAATFGGSAHTFASAITPASNDGGALGSASLMWSDLFLASGGVININNGNWVATHTSGILTVGTGDLRITTAGTNAASAVTVGGTQTLTNKTLTAPTINAYTLTGTGTIGNGCTLTTPIFSGSITGTYTLAGTPTITSPTITSPTITGAKVTPNVQTITGDGAITIQSGVVLLTKGSAAAVTLAAPSSQDGTIIEITSTTDFAHVVTVTGGLWDGTATTNTTITFPVVAGGAVRIIAFGTDWYVLSNQGTTIAP